MAAWSPPLSLLIHLAGQALHSPCRGLSAIWIGASIWPYLPALATPALSPSNVAESSIFVRARSAPERLWAADLALRSRAGAAVIIDGSGFDLPATRRLQLACEGGSTLCLLARPPWEAPLLSAALTRWLIGPAPSTLPTRRWTVELLRCKGLQPTAHTPRVWTLERDHATHSFCVVPDVLDRPGGTAAASPALRTG